MKNFLLLLLFVPFVTSAQTWHANADSGNLFSYFVTRNYQDCKPTNNNPQITQEDFNGLSEKVWKQTCPKDVQRNEFSRPLFDHKAGQTYYYSWRVRLVPQSGFNGRFALFQFKTSEPNGGSQNHPITIRYENNKIDFQYFRPCKSGNTVVNWKSRPSSQCSSNARRFILKSVSYTPGTWIEIVLGIKKGTAETGSNAGFARLWVNGVRQTLNNPNGSPRTTVELKTDDDPDYTDGTPIDEDSVYAKFGIYGGPKCDWDVTSFIHDLKAFTKSSDALQSLEDTKPNSNTSSNTFSGTKNLKRGNRYLQTNGTMLTSSTSNSGNSKKFNFNSRGNNQYNINPKSTGFIQMFQQNGAWRVRTSSQETGSNSNKYVWIAEPVGTNKYRFKNKASNRYLTIWNNGNVGSTTNGSSSQAHFNLVNTSAKQSLEKEVGQEAVENNISIYPNPVSDNFTINLDNIKRAEVNITDLLGKTVYRTITENNTVEISKGATFKSGLYIVTVKDELNNIYTSKLLFK